MGYRVAADLVVVLHLAFLVFLAAGGLLAWRWPRLVWLHLPTLAWAVVSITVGLACPLTPLEKHLRRLAGEEGYAGGFVDRYIEDVVYPERFTALLRGFIALAVVSGYVLVALRSRHHGHPAPAELAGRQRP